MLQVFCLGQFRVEINGQPMEIPSRPAQSLFAYLVLNAGRVHRREKLAGLLWPDSTDENARAYLRQGLWRIRKALETNDTSWQDYLQIDEISVSFGRELETFLDADLLLQNKAGEAWSIQELVQRVRVYAGELLPGFYDEWIILDRERLKSAYDQKMRLLLDQLEADQRWEDLLEWGERWIGLGHVPEPAYRALMLAHAMQGDPTAVSAVYQRCQKALSEELGISPSNELRDTYQQLLRGQRPERVQKGPQEIQEIASAPPAPGRSPYKGLESFDVEDAHLFFGREQLTARLLSRLQNTRLLVVVGASGSGKSSLVRAGLVPALKSPARSLSADHLSVKEDWNWQVGIMTPTAHPLQALSGLLGQGHNFPGELAGDAYTLDKTLRKRMANLGGERFLLVIDQFEEIFTLCQDEREREAFLKNLLAAGQADSDGPAAVIIVLRADFYAQCGGYPSLRLALSSQQEYIGPMTTEELRSAIERPAVQNGWSLEPSLVELILHEVRGEPGSLPLLSHALLETWKRRNGRWLTLKGYAEAGGVRGAIARTAEFVFNRQLSARQQPIARNIFLRLTELGEDMTGTRRRAGTSEFMSDLAPVAEVEEVLNTLAVSRLITLSENGVEIAHEALIREWPTLREWLVEDHEGLRLQHHLAEAARHWESLERDPGELYRGARLAQALEWSGNHPGQLNPLEREFLQAGQAEEQRLQLEKEQQQQRELEAAQQVATAEKERAEEQVRSNRRLRLFGAGISLIFLVTLVAAWIALDQRNRASQATHVAHSRELAAAAINNLEIDPQLSIMLALEAVKESRAAGAFDSAEIESALHQAVQFSKQRLVLRGHTRGVYGTAFSPDGTRISTAGKDGTIKIWDAQTGNLIRTLEGHRDEVVVAIFHPNGHWLASSSRDHSVRLWEVKTGAEIWTFPGDQGLPNGIDFSPDGSQLAIAMWDGRIVVLSVFTGKPVLVINSRPFIFWTTYNPDGRMIAAADIQGMVQLFDANTGVELERLDSSSYSQCFLAFSPDGGQLAVTSMDGWIKVWDLATREIRLQITGQPGSGYGPVSFSQDGQFLLTTSSAHNAQVWDSSTGQLVITLSGHTDTVRSADFRPDGRQIVTGSDDGTARIWDFSPLISREVAVIESRQGAGVPPASRRAVFSPDGRWLAAGEGGKGAIGLWDAETGLRVKTLENNHRPAAVTAVDFHPDGQSLASADMGGQITLWDPATGTVKKQWEAHELPVIAIRFDHTGDEIFSLDQDFNIKGWDTWSGELLEDPKAFSGRIHQLAIHPDDASILTTTYLGELSLTDINTGEELKAYYGQIGVVWDLAFNHDGTMIASASEDGSVMVWDTSTGARRYTLEHPLTVPVGLAFSPDDQQLATVGLDASLRLWDVASGTQTLVLAGISGKRPNGVAFSPDGKEIVVSSEEGISLYLADLDDLIKLAEARLARTFTPAECLKYSISAGCSQAEESLAAVQAAPRKTDRLLACHLPDLGGTSFSIFNRLPHEGMIKAAEQLGWDTWSTEPFFLSELRESMQTFTQSGCDLIIVSTFDPASVALPADHPNQRYVFPEAGNEAIWENVWSELYAEDQSSFMAGYVAAAMTETGIVGIFGGAPIPSVLRLMDGFALGVEYYNEQHPSSKKVELIGWQAGGPAAQGKFSSFFSMEEAAKITESFIAEGADIIFPVAGELPMIAASDVALGHKDVFVIGVDEDWAADHPQYASITLTSVVKHLDIPVSLAMEAITNGTFSGGVYVGTLENGGVSLAPFHEFESQVPDDVKEALERIKMEIIEGKIQTE